MVKKRIGEPWMPADEFGRSLPRGIGLNLLLRELEPAVAVCRDALGAGIIYADADFAAVRICGSILLLHADHAYSDHPMTGVVAGTEIRGVGTEIRLYGLDPDEAEAKARERGAVILAGSIDKPHGLRECYIVGPEGYIFVPCSPSNG